MPGSTLLLVLDLIGVLAFAVDGALTASRTARLDVVGVVTLGVITALGGGIMRDLLIGRVPPATFSDWRYLAVAATGGVLVCLFGHRMGRRRVARSLTVLDAAGLSLFAVTGTGTALAAGLGPVQSVLLGGLTAIGGGTLRDLLTGRTPQVLSSGLYAVPALLAATVVVLSAQVTHTDVVGVGSVWALVAAGLCFGLRMVGVVRRIDLPGPRQPPLPGGGSSPG
ncbi:trimeric intracellular cation channel family protein [Quadrisphaera setariae]|uniref:Trimeric intracellular cation channel family protein n=1 Tax=Quadrisphaera setariae TaxID=2593304 RepID=A0A5C8ZHT8_9ACTN|nr:trimeric intracellular cation channel family protein [Quadrisphaera setariae]TXR56719.1 trimeric intracellular cation channel family protein [Quadrisphaera setariae]